MKEKYAEDILKRKEMRYERLQLYVQRFSANFPNVIFEVKGRANIMQQIISNRGNVRTT